MARVHDGDNVCGPTYNKHNPIKRIHTLFILCGFFVVVLCSLLAVHIEVCFNHVSLCSDKHKRVPACGSHVDMIRSSIRLVFGSIAGIKMGNSQPLGTTFNPQQARDIFDEIDADKNGTLDHGELQQGVVKLGIAADWPEKRLQKFIRKFDANEDGLLDFAEFTKLCKSICRKNRKDLGNWTFYTLLGLSHRIRAYTLRPHRAS